MRMARKGRLAAHLQRQVERMGLKAPWTQARRSQWAPAQFASQAQPPAAVRLPWLQWLRTRRGAQPRPEDAITSPGPHRPVRLQQLHKQPQ